jgi:hypothetical protein
MTIGATCLRLPRLPKSACSRCWASRFRSQLARSRTNTVFITTVSRRAGKRGCPRRLSRRHRSPPTSNQSRPLSRSLPPPAALLSPTRLWSSRCGRSGGEANPAGPARLKAHRLARRQRPRRLRQLLRRPRLLPPQDSHRRRFQSRQPQPIRPQRRSFMQLRAASPCQLLERRPRLPLRRSLPPFRAVSLCPLSFRRR